MISSAALHGSSRYIISISNRVLPFVPIGLSLLVAVPEKALADAPLTPILGVTQSELDFGRVPLSSSRSMTIEIFNASGDSSSSLEITNISVTGPPFRLLRGPSLPDTLRGLSARAHLTVGCCPTHTGALSGALVISARRATNSPLHVPLVATGESVGAPDGYFIINFASGALAPDQPLAGPLLAYEFVCPSLTDTLAAVGIAALERLIPWFSPDDVHSTNQFGEDITVPDVSSMYLARLASPSASAVAAVASLTDHPCVLFAELDGPMDLHFQPNDDHFGLQWALQNLGPDPELFPPAALDIDVNATEAWDLVTGRPSIWVAVLDGGVDSLHADLTPWVHNAPNFWGNPPDEPPPISHHGTCVAGIIGAVGNNGQGVAGTAWPISLENCKVCSEYGPCFRSTVTAGISWASLDDRVDVLNINQSWLVTGCHPGVLQPRAAHTSRGGSRETRRGRYG